MKKILRRFLFYTVLIAALTFLFAGSALLSARMQQMQTGKPQPQVRLLTEDGRWRLEVEP